MGTLHVHIGQTLDINRSAAAALALLSWDTAISLNEEVALVWSLANSYWIKWLFLFNRYFTLCIEALLLYQRVTDTHSIAACRSWYYLRALARPIVLAGMQTMLIARVRALFDQARWVTVSMFVVFGIQVVSAIVAAVTLLPRVHLDSTCFPADDDTFGRIYDIVTIVPPLVLEVIMFILTVCKAQHTAKAYGWASQVPLLKLIIRDGSWACMLVFGVVIVNVILHSTQHGLVAWAGVDWLMTLVSFASSRLILNMLSYAIDSRHSSSPHITPPGGMHEAGGILTTHISPPGFISHAEYAYDLGCGKLEALPLTERKTWIIDEFEMG